MNIVVVIRKLFVHYDGSSMNIVLFDSPSLKVHVGSALPFMISHSLNQQDV